MQTKQAQLIWWISVVYILSFICYTPMLLGQMGVKVPEIFFSLKYGFVLVPALISILFLIQERGLKKYWTCNFKKISLQGMGVCILIAGIGLAITEGYSFGAKTDLWGNAYPSLFSFTVSGVYLFATALIEEIAWRGFLLERMAAGERRVRASVCTGIIWAGWHIPMWRIRNGLNWTEILPFFIWTVLVSVVLGAFYGAYRNILSVSVLHMVFNICFLAPVMWNLVVLFVGIVLYYILLKYRKGNGTVR